MRIIHTPIRHVLWSCLQEIKKVEVARARLIKRSDDARATTTPKGTTNMIEDVAKEPVSAMTGATPKLDSGYIDYSLFLSPSFDANEYANGIVQNASTQSTVHTSLSTLTFNIQDLNKQLRNEISEHYEELLVQAAGIRELEVVLSTVKRGMETVNASLNRLRTKLHQPYILMQEYQRDLERLSAVTDLLRKVLRFLNVARRAEVQYHQATTGSAHNTPTLESKKMPSLTSLAAVDGERERNLARVALTLKEVQAALEDGSLNGIDVVEDRIVGLRDIRENVETEGDKLFDRGLENINQADIASGLQILYNLGVLKGRIPKVLRKIQHDIERNITATLDTSTLHREVKAVESGYKASGRRMDGGSSTWAIAMWNRIGTLMDDCATAYEKVHAIEKVISIKRDLVTQISFLESMASDLDDSTPTRLFWVEFARTFEAQLQSACRSTSFLQQTFGSSSGYTRLSRQLEALFARVSGNSERADKSSSNPEAVLLQRSINFLEPSTRSNNSSPALPSRTNSPAPTSRSGSPAPGQRHRSDVNRMMQSFFGGK